MSLELAIQLLTLLAIIAGVFIFVTRHSFAVGLLVQEMRALKEAFLGHRVDFKEHKNENETAHATIRGELNEVKLDVARMSRDDE